ncbi:primosomal protein N' [Moraxella porci]|uniref:primosomal protein N' n=1 Tax=Moraxella porci TaxID=1288392 RepID=UPI002448489A|nr:primosomal protein N' [Moraxella porci]MDH2273271.1 primosomal protein N' [Moraxella porci]
MPHLHHDSLAQVALAVPVGDFFDYLCPRHLPLPQVGVRVLVPFGRRLLIGIVVGLIDRTDSQVPIAKLKPIEQILDDTPIIDDELVRLAKWLSHYYHHPLGDVYSVMLPTLINQGKAITQPIRHYRAALSDGASTATADDIIARLPKTAKKQRAILQTLIEHPDGISQTTLMSLGATRQVLTTLQDKGLIEPFDTLPQPPIPSPATLKHPALTLNIEQSQALDAITDACDGGQYQAFLLDGVTGSGKTEVYLQAMAHTLAQGKQVLILVPEIGLTPQTRARFGDRFDANICVLHSNLTDSERLIGWHDCQTGAAQIIIGTRSSVLYPFDHLGLIIIDEAHDTSYKQQDHLRYHACDVAMVRAMFAKIVVVLGTATPSLEQIKLVQDGKLHRLMLTRRAGDAKAVRYQLVDMRLGTQHTMHTDGKSSDSTLSPVTVREIRARLDKGEQVLVFLNRRGYAPILICSACGHQADCPNCDAHLTVHKNNLQPMYSTLRCHHCGYITPMPSHCPDCHSANLDSVGTGTTRLVEHLHALFANPQVSQTVYPILQIDRDTMRKKDAWDTITRQINTGAPAILVGTQMIAKGHHFPNVTLVVIANADLGFLSPDFRSPEHTAQRIIQVAGRAGRAEKSGLVLIQTLQPDSPLLSSLMRDGYHSFAHQLLTERQMLGLPPFSHAVLIRAESSHYARAKDAIVRARQLIPANHPFAINVADAPMTKKNNRYQVQMLILAKHRPSLHSFLDTWWGQVQALPSTKAVRMSIDVDPMGW